jgi:UDP-N-acetylmuramate dehydrogenase
MRIQEQVSLAPYTTFQIGGAARWFAEVTTEREIQEALRFAKARNLPYFILGHGSNVLISDHGFAGVVLHISLKGIKEQEVEGNSVLISAAAGEQWNTLVASAVHADLAGIECLAGIPGTVGGSPVHNVGAFGQEVSSTIRTVRAYDTETSEYIEFSGSECGFAYRRSIFSQARGRYIITRVDYLLHRGGAPLLKQVELRKIFPQGSQPTLAEVADAVCAIRQTKGLMLVEGDPERRNAGGFFNNPIVSEEQYERIAQARGTNVPHSANETGGVKLSAAWLIQQAGFMPGLREGKAAISTLNPLVLVNPGDATALDMIGLAENISGTVRLHFDVELEPAPVLLMGHPQVQKTLSRR